MWQHIPNFLKRFGLIDGLRLYFQTQPDSSSLKTITSVTVDGQQIWLRKSPSDTSIFFQIFVKQGYDTSEWNIQHQTLNDTYEAFLQRGKVPVIVDAGANIGFSAAWYAKRYPRARIFAIEPDNQNYNLLSRNVADMPLIIPIKGAVWSHSTNLSIENPTAGSGAIRVIEGGDDPDIVAFSISDLLAKEPKGELFIAKIDIEGGEETLFQRNLQWVTGAPLIVIETHDWLLPQRGTSKNFLRLISNLDGDFLFRGENVFFFQKAK